MKIFLSHSSKDKKLVAKVHEILSPSLAWFDKVDIEIGESIPSKINEGLEMATHFILFWSKNAMDSRWVRAELNAAFVKTMSDKCKIIVFALDDSDLPIILQPFKYERVNAFKIEESARMICEIILSQNTMLAPLNRFVNRTAEIGDIESYITRGYNLIIISGILGIGKSSLAKRANEWVYSNNKSILMIDLSKTYGLIELNIAFAAALKLNPPDTYNNRDVVREDTKRYFEIASANNRTIILKDAKSWLLDDGTPIEELEFIIKYILEASFFKGHPVFMTTSRFINIDPMCWDTGVAKIKIGSMSDDYISSIIKNNLLESVFFDENKNHRFAKHMYGYPLGARIAANLISVHGYDYYLEQQHKINKLTIELAKNLVLQTSISNKCSKYLQLLALSKSSLTNIEIVEAFDEFSYEDVNLVSEEAFFAGLVTFDNGRYMLEKIIEDYYFDLIYNSAERRRIATLLANYLYRKVTSDQTDPQTYFRLLQPAIFVLTIDNRLNVAWALRSDMIATLVKAMWEQYNHQDYSEAMETAMSIISKENNDTRNYCEAQYVKSLCLMRNEDYSSAISILDSINDKYDYAYKRDYVLGRIEKYREKYEQAISYFDTALLKYDRHISSMREAAECYFFLSDFDKAYSYIERAKSYDASNSYVMLLECRILTSKGNAQSALELLNNNYAYDNPSQMLFRRGRVYDELGEKESAIENYKHAIQKNNNNIDARLCLLNAEIASGYDCSAVIETLKNKVRGKRRCILLNIEARYIGYYGNREDEALALINSIDQKYIDKQWYAVKYQLLLKILTKHSKSGRVILKNEVEKEISELVNSFNDRYNESINEDRFLLPNT